MMFYKKFAGITTKELLFSLTKITSDEMIYQ